VKPILDFGFIQIPTFYLVISLSVTFVLLLLNSELERNPKFDRKLSFDLALIMMVGGFLGARLTHVFYEEYDFYNQYPLEIFKFWNGGFVFFGGFLTGLSASLAYLKIKKQDFFSWADFLIPFVSISYALGRFGCFFEGCCYGSSCDLPWAIAGRHPTQLYMALAELLFLGGLLYTRKKMQIFKLTGEFFLTWLKGHSLIRLIIEFYREDDRGVLIASLSISQWISLALLLSATAITLYRRKLTSTPYSH
jgi:phosphatidylglycerol---prolipoprotein diacylglyceryl transferase